MTPNHFPLFGHEKLSAVAASDIRGRVLAATASRIELSGMEGGGNFEGWRDVRVGYNPDPPADLVNPGPYVWLRATYGMDGKEYHNLQRAAA